MSSNRSIEKTKLELTLHSSIAQMTYKLDAVAIKSWFFLIARVFNHIQVEKEQEFEIPLKELCFYLGIETRNRKYLESMLSSIRQTGVRINILGKEKNNYKEVGLFNTVGIEDGMVTFDIHKEIKKKLLKFEEMFVILDILIIRNFKNKHAIALFIVFSDYLIKNLDVTEKILTLKQIRELLDIKENEYTSYPIFNRDVIKKAITEINEKSKLKVSYKVHKKISRKTESLKFRFSLNEETLKTLSTSSSKKEQMSLDDLPERNKGVSNQRREPKYTSVEPTSKKVLEFLLKHDIALHWTKHQIRLKSLIERLKEGLFNEFLEYCVDYTHEFNRKQGIHTDKEGKKKYGAFFCGLIHKDERLELFFESKEKEKIAELEKKKLLEERKEKITKKFNKLLRGKYNGMLTDLLVEHIRSGWEKDNYKSIFIEEVEDLCLTNPFIKEVVERKRPIGKSLVDHRAIIGFLCEKGDEIFNFCPISFENWKKEYLENSLNSEEIESLHKKAEKLVI